MITYRCTVTEDEFDDLIIPIRSLQMTLRNSPLQCYLSVVIPNILDYSDDIIDRIDGQFTLEHIATADDGTVVETELLVANIHNLRKDEGAKNRSGTLIGYRQITFSDTSTLDVPKATYKSTSEGVRRYRAQPLPTLKPQHYADVYGDTVQVSELVWSVSVNSNQMTQSMEIKELI